MKFNRNWICPVVGMVVATVLIVALILLCNNGNSEIPAKESDGETTIENSIVESEADTIVTTNPTSQEKEMVPSVDLRDGNEIYLDESVIAILTEMEAAGEEDLVNAILVGEMQLINYFADAKYSKTVICQIQRFYFDFYEALYRLDMDQLIRKLTVCFPSEGVELAGFAQRVQDTFGWGENMDFSYVINVEVRA